MRIGLGAFAVAGVACAAAPAIEVRMACRMIQGMGAAAAPVVARAMVRDTQPAAQAARLLSTMLAALAVAPMIAPVIGGALLHWLGWRAISGALALTRCVVYLLAEVTPRETPPPPRPPAPTPPGLGPRFRG